MNIGGRLLALRTAKGLSQGDIERRTGLLRCYISRVEHGHTTPSIETFERLAKALEIELYQVFFEGEGNPEHVPVSATETMGKREGELLGLYRRANGADRQLILQVARKLGK